LIVTELTYGSLCTGCDGIGLGLKLAGLPLRPTWMAEQDEAMSLVLKHEVPGIPNVGDIKTAPWGLAPRPAIMSSGDPCQTISIAGRREGRKDPRFLWPWVRAAYQAVRPPVLFFENVMNMVSHDGGRTMAERFEHLREDGYEVRWTVLGACAVGAPHHRHRWFALAAQWTGEGSVPPARRIGGSKAICGAPRGGGRFLLPSPAARDGDGRGEGDERFWRHRREVLGRANGKTLGAEVNLLPTPDASMATRGGLMSPPYALARIADPMRSSNLDDVVASLLPDGAVRQLLPTPMAERSGNNRGGGGGRGEDQPVRPSLDSVHALLPTPMVGDAEGGHSEPVTGGVRPSGAKRMDSLGSVTRLLPTPTAATRPEVWGKYAEAIALWEAITGIPAPEATEPGKDRGRRLAAALPEWMMGLRPGILTERLDRGDALRGAGNGCVPLQVAAAWKLLTAPLPD
jgi:DNA (cytosine-5)-methyltransferase 1